MLCAKRKIRQKKTAAAYLESKRNTPVDCGYEVI
jgi:hypothetical protein